MSQLHSLTSRPNQRGVSLVAAIFLLLLFATVAALIARVISTTHVTSAEDIQGAQAYQAARGGIEWGLYQVLDPTNATATAANAALPACFAGTQAVAGLGATVGVTCTARSYQEGTKNIRIYNLVSIATLTGPVSSDNGSGAQRINIERRLDVLVEKCRDTASTTSPYDC